MAATTTRQDRRAGIVFPIAALSVVGVALALRAIGDDGLLLLGSYRRVYLDVKHQRRFRSSRGGFHRIRPLPSWRI